MIYWLLFIVFYSGTPKLSSVSDLSWLAGVLFLLVLQNTIRLPGESTYRPPLAWAAPVFSTIMCLFFFTWGRYFINILYAVLMGTCGYYALRGLMFSRRQKKGEHSHQYFHMAVLAFVVIEYCLWTSSCFWYVDKLSSPYFWFDFFLSAIFCIFLPTLKKAVQNDLY